MKTIFPVLISVLFLTSNFLPIYEASDTSFSERNMEVAHSDTLIKMERTICYGFCPAYELTIQENGKVTFIGKDHVSHKGRAEGVISEKDLSHLIEAVHESQFMKIPSNPECESRMTDQPSVFLIIEMDEQRHYVNHYHGCKGFEYEDKLYDLEDKIDSLAGVEKWVEES